MSNLSALPFSFCSFIQLRTSGFGLPFIEIVLYFLFAFQNETFPRDPSFAPGFLFAIFSTTFGCNL